MDDFKKQTANTINIGGLKCPCCNDYRTFGCHGKQIGKLNKLRRTRLKHQLQKETKELQND